MTRPILLVLLAIAWGTAVADEPAKLVDARKIWDQSPHNAFTDLVRFQDRWFCVFREGKGHVSPDGALRVLTSVDGEKWESAALITSPDSDLRDAKITVTPDGQLMLCGAEALHDKSKHTHRSLAWFSKDGRQWSEKHVIGDPDFWLWRATWHNDTAYGLGYGCGKDQSVRLYASKDGRKFDTLVERLFDVGYPNESSIVFDGDTAYCLLRRDGQPNSGLLGVAQPPYRNWEWKDLGVRIGGPHMLRLPDGRLVAVVRLYDTPVRTSLCWIDPQAGKLTEFLKFPSGGDTSYPGLVLHEGLLWVSYYSSHEGKTNIYLAKVRLPAPVREIGSRRELFVDDYLVDRLSGKAELRLNHPVPQEIAIVHDAPWEGSGSGYHSIFKDGDRYRMYYAAGRLIVTPDGVDAGTHSQFCCYAESDDGIHWRKPELGLFEYQGSKANNIVLAKQQVGRATADPGEPAVFKDENPLAPPEARYKAVLAAGRLPGDHRREVVAFQSSDGLHWSPLSDQPLVTDGAFDSQNLAFWDAERGEYRLYWRYFTQGGYDEKVWNPQGHRAIRTATSKDFRTWNAQADLRYVDSPSEHLYTSQVKPYHRAPHLLLGFPSRYVERGHQDGPDHEARAPAGPDKTRRWSASLRALPELEHRQWRAKSSERYGRAVTEGLFMASRDGVTFKRWNEGFLRPGIERAGTWNYGHQFIAWHPVETQGTLEGAPPELSFFAVESYWTGNSSALRRYTLRMDGFVSVSAPMSGGALHTQPVRFSGKTLSLNFATSAAGSLRVELQDENEQPLPGYALADCEELFGDTLERDVAWTGGSDLSALAGRPVRLRFVLRDADLFSFRFRE